MTPPHEAAQHAATALLRVDDERARRRDLRDSVRPPERLLARSGHLIDMRNLAADRDDDFDPHRVWRTLARDVPRLREYLTETVLPAL